MGYETEYYGDINIQSKKAIRVLKKMMKEETEPFDYLDGLDLNKNCFSVNSCWKGDNMPKLCLFIALLDKNAFGDIVCSGEENGDIYRILINDGKVSTRQGRIVYAKCGVEFDDIETKKKVYEITKDKQLNKEIILANLEEK